MDPGRKEIVVTGLAAISAAGIGNDPFKEALRRGESLLKPVPEEILGVGGHSWGKVEAFPAGESMPPQKGGKLDRCCLLAAAAAGMALSDAAIDAASLDPARIGIVLGCGFANIANSVEFMRGHRGEGGEEEVALPSGLLRFDYALSGPSATIIQRFCCAESALLMAKRFLEEDRADVMLAGGVDELLPSLLRWFKARGQLRSFAGSLGEGAGILVLENGADARSRGARIRAGIGAVRTIGRFYREADVEGLERLLPEPVTAGVISLSGTAAADQSLLNKLPPLPLLDTARIIGRSLAMGGLSMAALVLMLEQGQDGLHLAVSPEGPYFSIDMRGGDPART